MYACGRHFHIGRNNNFKLKPQPSKKSPTTGQLHRKLKAIDKRLLAELKHRLYVAGQRIEADARAEKAKAQRDYQNALVAIGIKEAE